MTQSEIEVAVASDPDENDMVVNWDNAIVELPRPKAVLNTRIGKDVLEYFRKTGKGYQQASSRAFGGRLDIWGNVS